MMFDTLVSGEEVEEVYKDSGQENQDRVFEKDPILQYLSTYHFTNPRDLLDSATDPDLSWDEGDMPPKCIQVWSFNDFMEQYNQIYAWLNSIQVQYHAGKKKEGSSPRVEGLLKDLERDVQRRERFLRECGRMVGMYPALEGEVGWRVDHVISKWDMLANLRGNQRKNADSDLPDVYSDIELEVRCLRKWLKEMEERIDPLQFGAAASWSTRDRERKMAEYQVLQTDIESHGRIVKLVLSLCEDLTHNPGLYDLTHALKVAKSLEKRWHHIWLRSLEWQCLLEQWIQDPRQDTRNKMDLVDTDEEEPVHKIPRLDQINATPNFSPAATLLRVKRRKRIINPARGLDHTPTETQSDGGGGSKPSARRRIISSAGVRRRSSGSSASEDDIRTVDNDVTAMRTSDSDSIHHSDTSPRTQASSTLDTATPRSVDEVMRTVENTPRSLEDAAMSVEDAKAEYVRAQQQEVVEQVLRSNQNNCLASVLSKLEALEQREINKMMKDKVQAPLTYWDTSDEEAFSDIIRHRNSGDPHQQQHRSDPLRRRSNNPSEVLTRQYRRSGSDLSAGSETANAKYRSNLKQSLSLDNELALAERSRDRTVSLANLQEGMKDRTMEVFSLDSLEIPELDHDIDSFKSTQLILTGLSNDSLDDVSSRDFSKTSNSSLQDFSVESLHSGSQLLSSCSLPSPRSSICSDGQRSTDGLRSLDGQRSSGHRSSDGRLSIIGQWPGVSAVNQKSSEDDRSLEWPTYVQRSGEGKLTEFTSGYRRSKKKNRKRSVVSLVDESCQSDQELESLVVVLHESSNQLTILADHLDRSGPVDHERLMAKCSENINQLFHLLQSFNRENSFISQKKGRETRLLLTRWEQLLESLNENLRQEQEIRNFKNRTNNLREVLLRMMRQEGAQSSQEPMEQEKEMEKEEEEGDLDELTIKLHSYKDDLVRLERSKEELSELNLGLHTLSAQLTATGDRDILRSNSETWSPAQAAAAAERKDIWRINREATLNSAGQLQDEISGLYGLWERVQGQTAGRIERTEETLSNLNLFHQELFNLRSSLRKDALKAREGSCDSGISDASTDQDFPLREQQLERLRKIASNLELTLDPRSKACAIISKTLETTSFQLKDLKLSFEKLKSARSHSSKAGSKHQPRAGSGGHLKRDANNGAKSRSSKNLGNLKGKSASRSSRWSRRVAKMALAINLLLAIVFFISWLCGTPRCCDTIGSLSMVPQLKYVNGPPPI